LNSKSSKNNYYMIIIKGKGKREVGKEEELGRRVV